MPFGVIGGTCSAPPPPLLLSPMDLPLPPTIWATLLGIAFTGLFALLGIVYRSLKTDVDDNETEVSDLAERQSTIEKRVRTLFFWAFGNEGDSTDQGFAADIQSKLASLDDKLESIAQEEEANHEEVVERLDEVILSLNDEDALEFDREDLE
jgi:hypothetical protein